MGGIPSRARQSELIKQGEAGGAEGRDPKGVNMEYRVVSTSDHERLAGEVTRLLSEGWLLYGGVVVTPLEHEGEEPKHYSVYTQALVKGSPIQVQNQIVGFAPSTH